MLFLSYINKFVNKVNINKVNFFNTCLNWHMSHIIALKITSNFLDIS